MMMITTRTALLLLALCASAQVQADGRLVGSWVKHHTQQEHHAYPGDTNWNLEVSFQTNGVFVWHSTRSDGDTMVDESVSGTYSIDRSMINFTFDNPSRQASKRLSEWFAFWPAKLKGQQSFSFQGEFLVLRHEGYKLWFHLKRKNVEQDKSSVRGKPRR